MFCWTYFPFQFRCEGNRGAYMTSSSMLNLSFGLRKQARKEGRDPSDITNLQEKAEPRVVPKTTPYSSSKYRSEFTPPRGSYSRDNTPTGRPTNTPSSKYSSGGSIQKGDYNRRFLDSSRGSDDDLKTPDYWLKSYGRGPRVGLATKSSRETPPWRRYEFVCVSLSILYIHVKYNKYYFYYYYYYY